MKKVLFIFVLSLVVISCSTTKKGNMTQQFDRNIQPKPGPAPKIHLGQAQTFTLANGLKVLVVENHKLPRVSATLTIDNEPLLEGEKAGVSGILGSLLGSGTTHISKDDFNEKVDFLGARINYGSQSARMSSLSKFFPEVFALLADGALNPVFSQEEFDKKVAQTVDGIKSGEKSVGTIASRVEAVLAFGRNHPYGEFTTVESVKNLKLKDVQDLYNTYYKPNNAYLVIVGDVKFNEVKALVTQNFGDWKQGDLPEYTLPTVNNVKQTEIDFIDMPNASQTQVSVVSTTNLKMTDPDYHAVLVANQILGGDFNSYLNMNLREAHAYTYGARSSLRPNKYISKFKTSVQVRNAVADSTVIETFKELNRIRTEKVTAENLKNVKAGYAGKFVMAVEKPETVARYALNIEKYKLPKDFYETYLEKINAVTIEDVQRVAQKYFNKDQARIIITSKGLDVLPNLEKLGYPINYFDKEGNPTEKPSMQKTVPSNVTPTSVLDNYFKALGGKNIVEKIKSIEQVYEMSMQGMAMTQTMKMQAPNKMNMETSMMGQVAFKMVFDGETGYMEQMGAKIPMPKEQIAEMKSKKGIFEELYYDVANLSLDGIVPVNGKDTYKMLIAGKNQTVKYFDVSTGLLAKEEKTTKGPDGSDIIIPTSFSDYKAVNGILFPHVISTKAMGQDIEMTLKSIEVNKDFSEGTFK